MFQSHVVEKDIADQIVSPAAEGFVVQQSPMGRNASVRLPRVELRSAALHLFREVRERTLEQSRPTVSWVLRLTVSATAAYVAAKLILGHQSLLAPLTALLVTQVTLFSIVRQGIDRVISVVAGVTLAVLFSSFAGLTWWSLALLIATALLIGQLLRLGDNLIEVPVTAMFVMATGVASTNAAIDRVFATLIGAVVGLGINILVPPGVRQKNAGAEIAQYGDAIAQHLEGAAGQLPDGVNSEQAWAWLVASRNLSTQSARIDRLLSHAEESRKLNVRALNKPNATYGMRQGLDALEHCSVALRSVFRGINDVIYYPDDVDDIYPQPAREITAAALIDLANAIRAFAKLVEAQGARSNEREELALLEALDKLNATRLRAQQHLRESTETQGVYELNVFMVASTGRVIRELDLRGHTWLHDKRLPYADEKMRAVYAAKRLQAITRQLSGLNRKRRVGPRQATYSKNEG